MSGLNKTGRLSFGRSLIKILRVEFLTIFFWEKIVVARSFTADGNLLQPTGSVNRTPCRPGEPLSSQNGESMKQTSRDADVAGHS